MPIQIRVVIPNATPLEQAGTEEDVPPVKTVPRTDNVTQTNTNESGSGTGNKRVKKRPFRPTSAPVCRRHVHVPVRPHDITMHVASIYDIENEHDYIMDKALKAYTKHRMSEENAWTEQQHGSHRSHHLNGNPESSNNNNSNIPVTVSGHPHLHRHVITSPPINADGASSTSSSSSWSCQAAAKRAHRLSASSDITHNRSSGARNSQTHRPSSARIAAPDRFQGKTFQLSLCTLKDANGNEPAPVPYPHSTPGARGYLPLQRPWSAAPAARLDAIREVSLANSVTDSTKSARPAHQYKLHVRPPSSPKMDPPPISRSTAYQIRNQTTYSWPSEDSNHLPPDPMTMSCPNARTFEEHMRNARAYVPRDPNPSPVVVKGKALASPTSPHQRPSSAYSYDGGFFLSATNSNKDFFVIHPDWVSESMTVQKLSLNERQGRSRTLGVASGRRGFPRGEEGGSVGDEDGEGDKRARRCKSAPPPKHRNPITWS